MRCGLVENSIAQWCGVCRLGPTRIHTVSFDCRVVGNRAATQDADAAHCIDPAVPAQVRLLKHKPQRGPHTDGLVRTFLDIKNLGWQRAPVVCRLCELVPNEIRLPN
jgi:hypothetical protein